jgi:serine/threonine-protein kinase
VRTDAKRFLNYELQERIGLGVVGETFRARDVRLGRPVALKLLSVETASDREFVERFRREMPLIAALDEPHLIPIHDFGFQGGRLYLAMHLVEGATLHELLEGAGPLPAERALGIVDQVADALDAVHAADLVHGDVNTATVHVAPHDFAYLVDVGLIPLVGVTPTALTATATTPTTLACVAPERLTGRPVDGRSDVYSLACVLVECLTGAQPYAVDDLPSLVYAHLYPDASEDVLEAVPPALREVLRRGLAKRPQDRFPSAGEFVHAARRALAAEAGDDVAADDRPLPDRRPAGALPPRPSVPRARQHASGGVRVAAIVVAVLAVLALTVLAALVVSDRSPRADAGSSDPDPRDGEVVASGDGAGTAAHEHVPEPAETTAASLAEPRIERQVKVGQAPHEIAVAPDGGTAYIADPEAGAVFVWDTATQAPSATIRIPQGPPQMVSLSPDGERLYVSVFDEGYRNNAVVTVDTVAREVVSSGRVGKGPYAAETTPDGNLLYVPLFDEPHIDIVDPESGKVVDRIEGAANPHWIAFREDGRIAYTANHFSDVVTVIDLESNEARREIPVGDAPHSVELSPDGTRLAVANYISDDVSIIDTSSSEVVETVQVGAGPQDVTYAPDGRHLYTANVDDGTVSVIDTRTNEVTARIPTGTSPTSVVALPDGTTALVSNFDAGTVTVLRTGSD